MIMYMYDLQLDKTDKQKSDLQLQLRNVVKLYCSEHCKLQFLRDIETLFYEMFNKKNSFPFFLCFTRIILLSLN